MHIYRVWDYLRFQVSIGGLRTYSPQRSGIFCIGRYKVSKILISHKACILLLSTNTGNYFPWRNSLISFHFEKISAKYPSLYNHSLSVNYSSKPNWSSMKRAARSALNANNSTSAFPWKKIHSLRYAASLHHVFITFHHTEY